MDRLPVWAGLWLPLGLFAVSSLWLFRRASTHITEDPISTIIMSIHDRITGLRAARARARN